MGSLQTSAFSSSLGPEQVGEWGPLLAFPTQGKHMILMPTNKVLVWPTGTGAYVWNPATGEFTPVPATFGNVHCAGHATLADGSPIVVGGEEVNSTNGIKITATFDPATETWTNRTPMKYARWYPTVTTLGDGRVLAVSGRNETGSISTIPEIYDPQTNAWTELTGASRTQAVYPFMYLLPSGKVYDAAPKSTTFYLDVTGSGSWSPGPLSGWDNSTSGFGAESGAMYDTGKIIRSGGGDPAHARTAVIDMTTASPQWREVESMAFPRRRHDMVVLADGSVLAVGGTRAADDPTQAVLEAERWDPATEQWDTMAAMSVPRMYHSATILLPDGSVVAAGGDNPASQSKLTAQIYKPPYFFKGSRPAIISSPESASYGSTFTVGTDTAGVSVVALIRPGAVTHSIDMNQRYVPLAFTQSGNDLTVTAPSDGNVAPPGAYMLVVEDANGVPSPARWIRLGAGTPPPPPPPTPTADFTATPRSGAAPLAVSFTNLATGSTPMTFEWDFQNDGAVDSTAPNPQFTYASAGTYTVRLNVTNPFGSDEEVKAAYVTVSPPPPPVTTVTFTAVADAYVKSSNPKTNTGSSKRLRVDSSPVTNTYLKFDVFGLSALPRSAKIRLYVLDAGPAGGSIFSVSNAWSESGSGGINYNNAPPITGSPLSSVGGAVLNTWLEFDVTPAVTGNGTWSFAVKGSDPDSVDYGSRESAAKPQLVVTP